MNTAVTRQAFGRLTDGREVEIVSLRSASGFEARVISYGAVLQALHVADRDGQVADVVLGHDDLAGYLASRDFFGATIGRYANRIAGGRFDLDGQTVEIEPNDGPNALHGGADGFDRQLWTIAETGTDFVRLERTSADGEGGFPGELSVSVTYRLAGEAALEIAFEARTTRPTVVNLTNHSFFNLGGVADVRDVLSHRITLVAETYLPIDAVSIPEGRPAPVAGTPFDFRSARPIGERIREGYEQIRRGRGYDHNWCVDGTSGGEPRLAARVEDPASGRVLELLTDQPGVQFYSGNFLDGTVSGKGGQSYRMGDAFCLEPQGYPDTPNRPDFPTARLDPGGVYRHHSIFRFSTI
ncbi:aldose epimerase family protein [Aureimonas pseudogalii]|uniref:Aldose 1-epimerase n=1 Tax=Aureimonas pseudogalii TaxID=1744844 RepID=A0A7W6EB49_9HYPH|nr:aldose epimerase family protein [Aureimonas pseudogalii]MBB3998077.1 aldose 1-epimerase [Aureimonas pseudogalii]